MDEYFCDLMELPLDERMDALEAIPDLSADQKNEIRQMLAQAERADVYFSGTSAAVKIMPTSTKVEHEGEMCGPYKLIRKLGEGGFGLVWLAEQEKPLKRTVAVKVIKAGMDTEEVLARFDAEKHALARMDHPNIAKVLDAGITERGRPYFVMEMVEGQSITRYCHNKGVTLSERLRLFADVCAALNHAHQKGIIHRDIKPSNVIITEIESKPVVKVIDFGIAKAIEGQLTDYTLRTRAEQWIGTPAYMSPEQAGLGATDVDTRSDIYGLGVLLYEMITDEAPFDSATLMKAGYEEMRRIIREVEPAKPSIRIATAISETTKVDDQAVAANKTKVKAISSELDWIVMKAMEKAKERRYESAASLSADIARYLANEPILARPPSTLYLFSKFARRHRLGIYISTAFLMLVFVAVILSVWLALRARDAEQIAQERLVTALADRNAKELALEDTEAVTQLVFELFKRPNPDIDGRKVTIVEALDAAAYKLDHQLLNQPERHVMLLDVLVDTYENLGQHESAVALKKKADFIRVNKSLPLESNNSVSKKPQKYNNSNSELLRKQWDSAITSYGKKDERAIKAQCDYAVSIASDSLLMQKVRYSILKDAYEKSKTVLGKQHSVTTEVQTPYARMMHMRGNRAEAIQLFIDLCKTLRERDGPVAPTTLHEENTFIGFIKKVNNQWPRSNHFKFFLTDLLDQRKKILGVNHVQTARIHYLLADHYLFDRNYSQGLEHANMAIPALVHEFGVNHPHTIAAMGLKAIHLAVIGRLDESIQILNVYCPGSSENIELNTLLSVLQVWTKDFDGYNSTRRRMLQYLADQCAKSQNRSLSSRQDDFLARNKMLKNQYDTFESANPHFNPLSIISIVQLCCLRPFENEEQGSQILEILEFHEKDRKGLSKATMPISLQAYVSKWKSFVKYRCNDFIGATKQLELTGSMRDAQKANIKSSVRPSYLFMKSMIDYKSGRKDQARSLFLQGEKMLPSTDSGNQPFKGMLIYSSLQPLKWILHQEAKSLIVTNLETKE